MSSGNIRDRASDKNKTFNRSYRRRERLCLPNLNQEDAISFCRYTKFGEQKHLCQIFAHKER